MKTAHKISWLQGSSPTHGQGFTLIEMTVVLLIGGVLAAIALPSFISQTQKAQQAEAKTSLATINRAQQAYFMETARFTDQFTELGVGVKRATKNYQYLITVKDDGTLQAAHYAESRNANLKPYTGMAAIANSSLGEPIVDTVICVADERTQARANTPVLTASGLACATGTRNITR